MAKRLVVLLQGVAWFMSDPLTYARFAHCCSTTGSVARSMNPAKKRWFTTTIVFRTDTYPVLPCGLVHGWCTRRGGVDELRVLGVLKLFRIGRHVFTERRIGPVTSTILLHGRLLVVTSAYSVSWESPTNMVTAMRCAYCHHFHTFIKSHGLLVMTRSCYGRTMRYFRGVSQQCVRREAICHAVVAYAKTLKRGPW